jgi:superfamily II DNA or RNA helicase/diadenosine tetraphosphate (Ap4A) HIT family hydrolase/SOS-response transcriptional repressor LexA
MADSPFLAIPPSEWVAHNEHAFAIWDRFPVSPGHVLVISRRPVANWFDAHEQEQASILNLITVVRNHLDETLKPRPDGYNVGFNTGEAAGQTVMHLHVHVIPRYAGDVKDPRGGVRYVIPDKANYLVGPAVSEAECPAAKRSSELQLSTGHPDSPLWEELSWRIAGARSVDILASFVQMSGLDVVESRIFDALRNGARLRVLVSDYLYISDPKALDRLCGWCDSALEEETGGTFSVRLIELERIPSAPDSFHPKAWYIADDQGGLLTVGSSNLSRPALQSGIEWNLLSTGVGRSGAHAQFATEFDRLWEWASPLTPELVDRYAAKARLYRETNFVPDSIDVREILSPRPWQVAALESLGKIRDAGYRRALVAVATGMGKTWLAAFDAKQFGNRVHKRPRILIVAHRAHILAQAEAAVSQVLEPAFGEVKTAWYVGPRSDLDGELVVASIQKLSRPEGLERLAREQFDYVVIDEVHHAHAPTYRRVLAKTHADFILGLTATPERTDGVDVASIFDDNLAYHATIGDGIAEESLVPFHYIGLKDTVDFRQIPWRNGRFDLDELECRVASSDRMARLWSAMEEHPGERTIVFCCSRRHAIFARDWLRTNGISSAAVFSGGGGDSCGESLQQLRRGELATLCVVDMFNEGLDIPAVDRVLMLRPTESKIIFLQQLGRGLRASQGKSRLLVVDFVGNHRIFAQRLIHLLSLHGQQHGWGTLKDWLNGEPARLPPGCLLDVELAARDMLKQFMPQGSTAGIEAYRALRDELGRRPTASELLSHGYRPKVVSKAAGDWFGFVENEGDLNEDEREVVTKYRNWLRTVETTSLNRCYKMVVLRVLLDQGQFFDSVDLSLFSQQCRRFLRDHPILRNDLAGERHAVDHERSDDNSWTAWWIKWPINRWLDVQNGAKWCVQSGNKFWFNLDCPKQLQPVLEKLTEELVDWRLVAYSKSHGLTQTESGDSAFEAKVSHAGGRPILFVPEKSQQTTRPVGPTEVELPDGARWEFKFVKVACNVARPVGEQGNQLADLLRSWFGPNAGLPGTDFQVRFESRNAQWHASPIGVRSGSIAHMHRPSAKAVLQLESSVAKSAQYKTHVPVYDITIAAGGWGPDAVPEPVGWLRVPGNKLSPNMFAAQVSGRSMEPRIHDGDWCLFAPCPAGSRQNRLLLIQVNSTVDPEDGGRYTIKRYHSTKTIDADGWQHESIELQPLNPDYQSIRISAEDADDIRIIGEFVTVIRR